jgi:hypothetical protein
VPRVEREEFVNVGVIVYSQAAGYLQAATEIDAGRLLAIDPETDIDDVAAGVAAFVAPCSAPGGEDDVAGMSLGERFRWLTAPRSTVVQTGAVHAGLTDDPGGELTRLVAALVTVAGSGGPRARTETSADR